MRGVSRGAGGTRDFCRAPCLLLVKPVPTWLLPSPDTRGSHAVSPQFGHVRKGKEGAGDDWLRLGNSDSS